MKRKKEKTGFVHTLEFRRNNLYVEITDWTFTTDKKSGRDVSVCGRGIDGQLYDGVANINKDGKVTKIEVDIKSARWE